VTATDLGSFGVGNNASAATAINASGMVAGWSYTGQNENGPRHAFLYNGTMTDLGTLGGASSQAFGINNAGQVVGQSNTADSLGHAFMYSGGIMSRIDGPGAGVESLAFGVNNLGQAVGYIQPGIELAALFSGGTATDLNSLIPSNSGWTLKEAWAINDLGQIVGWGGNPSLGGGNRAFLLTPVPEPTSLALFGVGAAGRARPRGVAPAHGIARRPRRAERSRLTRGANPLEHSFFTETDHAQSHVPGVPAAVLGAVRPVRPDGPLPALRGQGGPARGGLLPAAAPAAGRRRPAW
jgi:probable HAF family extracellular repeat protein